MSAPAEYDVIVVGAGPAGLLLAAELQRRGVAVALLERRTDGAPGTRAIGVHAPTLAALEKSGATERILARAVQIPRGIARTRDRVLGEVRFDRPRARFPFVAAVPQADTEAAVGEGGPEPIRGVQVLAVQQRAGQVFVHVRAEAGEREMSARVVVVAAGASGRDLVAPITSVRARSYPDSYLMTDLVSAPSQPSGVAVITIERAGVIESFPLPGGGRRLVAWMPSDEPQNASGPDRHAVQLRRAVAERTGDDELATRVASAQAFGIRRVLLRRMRSGRVFAIGDTAHEISPIGGQGMNLGLLDAATLAPLLARRMQGFDSTAEFDRWERDRLVSARTAARLASMNTAMGRPRSRRSHGATTLVLGASLASPLSRFAARAYAMGLDRNAAITPRRSPG